MLLSLLLPTLAVSSLDFQLGHPRTAVATVENMTKSEGCAQCFCGTSFADAETRCHAPCPDGTDAPCAAFAGEKCYAGCTGCAGVPTPAPPAPTPAPPGPAPAGPCACPNCKAAQSTSVGSWLYFVWTDGTANIYEYFSSTSGTIDVYLMDSANYAKLKAGSAFTYDAAHSRKGVTCFNDTMPVLPQGEVYRVARCVASASGACQIAAAAFSGGGPPPPTPPAPPPPPPAPSPPSKGGDFCGTSFSDANSRCHAPCPGGTDSECKAFAGEHCFASCSACAGVPTPAPPPPPAPTPGKTHYGDPHKATCLPGELITTINGASGNFCDPPCPGGACPTDKPAGMQATPTCLLTMQGQSAKYCALVCNGAAGSSCAPGATCKAVNGMNFCTYDS